MENKRKPHKGYDMVIEKYFLRAVIDQREINGGGNHVEEIHHDGENPFCDGVHTLCAKLFSVFRIQRGRLLEGGVGHRCTSGNQFQLLYNQTCIQKESLT